MGDSKTEIIQPSEPPAPSTAQAIREWRRSLPKVYQIQMRYLPAFARIAKGVSEELYPETAAIQERLAEEALRESQSGRPPESIQKEYLSNLRANLGTNIGSPIAADYTSRKMLNLQQDWRNYYRNLALSLAGRQQLVQPPSYSTMTGGFTPSAVMGYKAGTYGPYVAASRPIVTQAPTPNYLGAAGSLMQGIGAIGQAGWF